MRPVWPIYVDGQWVHCRQYTTFVSSQFKVRRVIVADQVCVSSLAYLAFRLVVTCILYFRGRCVKAPIEFPVHYPDFFCYRFCHALCASRYFIVTF